MFRQMKVAEKSNQAERERYWPKANGRQSAEPTQSLLNLQQAAGNLAMQRLLREGAIQAKLTISQPNDPYEQEADRVAEAVMRMAAPAVGIDTVTAPQIRRLCPECQDELKRQPLKEEEEEERVQTKPIIPGSLLQNQTLEEELILQALSESAGTITVNPSAEDTIHALPVYGQPLPDSVRSFMEPRFNTEFSSVRIHTDSHAHELARSVNAKAFTVGRDIVFGAGHYAPETEGGKRLLAHELTHVVQQGGERKGEHACPGAEIAHDPIRSFVEPNDRLERETEHPSDALTVSKRPDASGVAKNYSPLTIYHRSAPKLGNGAARLFNNQALTNRIQKKEGESSDPTKEENPSRTVAGTSRPERKPLIPEAETQRSGNKFVVRVLGQTVAIIDGGEGVPIGNVDIASGREVTKTKRHFWLQVRCGLGWSIQFPASGIQAMNRMIPHWTGTFHGIEEGVERPYDKHIFATFGQPQPKVAGKTTTLPPAETPSQKLPRPVSAETEKREGTAPKATGEVTAKENPYRSLTVEERATKIKGLLDKWFSSQELLSVFQASKSVQEFIELQKKVDLNRVLDKLDDWEAVQLGTLGPIFEPYMRAVNQKRADYIVRVTHDYGIDRAQVFVIFMFNSMYNDDVKDVLGLLASDRRLAKTILQMSAVKELLNMRGIDLSQFSDRPRQASDYTRAIWEGLSDILSSSELAKSGTASRYYGERFALPKEYQHVLEKIEKAQLEQALSPGNVALGVFDYLTLGVPVGIIGLIIGTGRGAKELVAGDPEEGVKELVPAMLVVLTFLGVKAYRAAKAPPVAVPVAVSEEATLYGPKGPGQFVIKGYTGPITAEEARVGALLRLNPEAQGAAGVLMNRLGKQGIIDAARYVQADSQAALLVHEKGLPALEALVKAKGNLGLAQQLYYESKAVVFRAGSGLPWPERNVALGELKIRIPGYMKNIEYLPAVSGPNLEGTLKGTGEYASQTKQVKRRPGMYQGPRRYDSEVKVYENAKRDLGVAKEKTGSEELRGKLTIYTEREPCPSCEDLKAIFEKEHPGIEVEVHFTHEAPPNPNLPVPTKEGVNVGQ